MAEAILNSKGKDRIIAYSAGSDPEKEINPYAIKVMQGMGIDISGYRPKPLKLFADQYFDFVITLCDRARNQCPVIPSPSIHLHWGFADPKYFEGTDNEILMQVRTITIEMTRRIDLFLGLPLEKSDRVSLMKKLDEIVEIE